MDSKIWISVLLCTYNDEKYIAKTIESILAQTYSYFEFIIINDGSKDQTGEIIDSFKDDRIRHIRQENAGLTNSLNYGISLAKYDWIARIDGDDIALPERFEKQVQVIDDEVAVIGAQFYYINEYDDIIGKVQLPTKHEHIVQRGLSGAAMFNHPSVLMNKKKILEVEGYDPLIEAAEDLDLWLKVSSKGTLVNLPDFLMKYRMHSQKVSVLKRGIQFQNMEISVLRFRRKIFRNLTTEEYKNLNETLEKNTFFRISKYLNFQGGKAKGILLKFINLQFRINQLLINQFIK